MSLVENIINQITTAGGITKPQGFDLGDDTFAKVLEKASGANTVGMQDNLMGEMGSPAGLQIEPLEGVEHAEAAQDQIEAVGETKLVNEVTEPIEIKDMNVGDYFSSLLKSDADNNSGLMDFAKKHATNAYDIFGRSYVTDVKELADDIASMIQ